jgi:hypothetical protein
MLTHNPLHGANIFQQRGGPPTRTRNEDHIGGNGPRTDRDRPVLRGTIFNPYHFPRLAALGVFTDISQKPRYVRSKQVFLGIGRREWSLYIMYFTL